MREPVLQTLAGPSWQEHSPGKDLCYRKTKPDLRVSDKACAQGFRRSKHGCSNLFEGLFTSMSCCCIAATYVLDLHGLEHHISAASEKLDTMQKMDPCPGSATRAAFQQVNAESEETCSCSVMPAARPKQLISSLSRIALNEQYYNDSKSL